MAWIRDVNRGGGAFLTPLELDAIANASYGATKDIEAWPDVADAARRVDVCSRWRAGEKHGSKDIRHSMSGVIEASGTSRYACDEARLNYTTAASGHILSRR
jgi:hypothetical protein